MKTPLETLRHHVSGAIERGEKQPVVSVVNKPMEYTLCKHKNQWAIFAATSRCYVLFGTKKRMIERLNQLNKGK